MIQGFKQTAWVLLAGISLGSMAGGSIDAGKIKFSVSDVSDTCIDCHGTPPNLSRGAGIAANRPDIIRSTIQSNPEMKHLDYLSDADLADIAAYIGHPTLTDADCTFNWAENLLPTLLTPKASSATLGNYYYRYYSGTNIYIASSAGKAYLYDGKNPVAGIVDLGSLGQFYNTAINAGCQ